MSSPKPMFVSMLRDGFVMTYRGDESDKMRVGHAGDRGDNDKWILETGEEPNTVALKCFANGKYLTGERKHYGKVSLRDEKEWWEIYRDNDRNWPPGSFALCMVGCPDVCLCVSESSKFGVGRAGWRIEMYVIRRREAEQHPTKLWYFMDGDGSSGLNKSSSGSNKPTVSEDSDATSAQKERDSKLMHLSAVRDGYVLTYREKGNHALVVSLAGDNGNDEKWIVEYGNEPNTVALKCAANGKYLTGVRKHRGECSLRDEVEWWNVVHDNDKARSPGSYLLSMVGSPEFFLNVMQSTTPGPGKDGSEVMMFEWSNLANACHKTWYFTDTDGSNALTRPKASEADSASEKKELEDREAALAKKEQDIASEKKALEAREAALSESEKNGVTATKASEDREAALAQKEKDNASKTKAVEDREAALSEKEKDTNKALEGREAALAEKEKNTASEKKATDDREAAFSKTEKESNKASEDREAACSKREHDIKQASDDREAALSKKEKDSKKAADDREAAIAKKEQDSNKALEDREAALAQRGKDSASGKKASDDRDSALSQREKDSEKALKDREAALAKKEKKEIADKKALEKREADLAQKEKDQVAEWEKKRKENESTSGKKLLQNGDAASSKKEKDALAQREAAVAQREKSQSADKRALEKKESDLAQKEKDQAAEWEKKMRELQSVQQSSTQQKKSVLVSAPPPGCGYKHYKPPRKLGRKVIGLVYEQ